MKRYLMLMAGLVYLFSLSGTTTVLAQNGHAFVRQVRAIESEKMGLTNPAGLAFSPGANVFHVVEGRGQGQPPPAETDIIELTPFADRVGSARIAAAIKDPINTTFDSQRQRLLIYQSPANKLVEVLEDPDGNLDPATLTRHDARHFGLQKPQGMTVDPASGHVFFLDSVGPRILRVEPEPDGGFDNAVISKVDLQSTGLVDPRGLAFDQTTAHLHVVSPAEQKLYELDQSGRVVASRDLSEFGVGDPQGMVFAPSGDLTDDPGQMSLYLADSGLVSGQAGSRSLEGEQTKLESAEVIAVAPSSGQIVELSFVEPLAVTAPMFQATLVQGIDTSPFPSPDPAGITHLPAQDRLLIADSEVNEMPIFTGDNLFELTRSGTLLDSSTTVSFSDEPTGVTLNPANGHLFFSDDTPTGGRRLVYEMNPGPDEVYHTSDDIITSFATSDFSPSSNDPEGVTFDPTQGVLFIADGLNNEVYRVAPGANGVFDGIASAGGDDQVTSFDTASLGITDPEGIAYDSDNGYLYLVGNFLAHIKTDGTLLRFLDISTALPVKPAGLAYAPGSSNPGVMNLYIADRGVDNDSDPDENDGRVYEISIPWLTPGNSPPQVDAGPDQTVTLPANAMLDGTLVSDDEVPIAAPTTWSQVSGPGSVIFADPNARDATATFTLPGSYVLRLTADDGELTGSDEVAITVTGNAAVSFQEVRIADTDPTDPSHSSDDAEEIDNAASSLDRFSTDLDMLFDRGVNRTNKIVGLRFNGVNVPLGATITNAYVQFQVDEASLADTSLTVQGEAADNPVTFGVEDKIAHRPRTTAQVSWSPAPWLEIGAAGYDQRTPNIAAIIKEIVDRPGWSSGNSLAIMISGSGERTAEAFEGDPTAAPMLHVEYQLMVPEVVGLAQADAKAAIVAAGLTVGTVIFENNDTVPAGAVISQNPGGGTQVAPGTTVDLVVWLGPQVFLPLISK